MQTAFSKYKGIGSMSHFMTLFFWYLFGIDVKNVLF